ncbi:MAG: LptF/LptG family permease [Bacteriovoracia bacterium]
MKLIDRYILTEFTKFFLLAAATLALVSFFSEFLRGVWDAEVPVTVLFKYNAMAFPLMFCQMLPPAAMLATTITLSLLNRKNELTAIQAAGVGISHISFLIFGAIFIACCASLVMYDRVIPPLASKRTVYYWKVIKGRHDFTLDIKTSKIWYRSKNFIYNLKLYDKEKSTIQGLGVFFFDDKFKLVQHIEAQKATYNYDQNRWQLFDGMLTIFPDQQGQSREDGIPSGAFPLSKSFDKKQLTLPESPKDFLEIERQVDTLRLKDLRRFIQRNKEAGLDTRAYEVDFHSRLAISFIAIIMGLLAVPFSIKSRRQGGLGRDLLVCISWIFTYWISFSVCMSLGKSGAVTPWIAVWAPCFFFMIIALFMAVRGKIA